MHCPVTGTLCVRRPILMLWLDAVHDLLVPIARGLTAVRVALLLCPVTIRMLLVCLAIKTRVHKSVIVQCGPSISKTTVTMPRGSAKSFTWEYLVAYSKMVMDVITMVEMVQTMLDHGTKDLIAWGLSGKPRVTARRLKVIRMENDPLLEEIHSSWLRPMVMTWFILMA